MDSAIHMSCDPCTTITMTLSHIMIWYYKIVKKSETFSLILCDWIPSYGTTNLFT